MIAFCHLLNDNSGSPRVLSAVIPVLARPGDGSRLYLGSGGAGCLGDAPVRVVHYWYRRTPVRLATMVTYMVSQVALFFRLLASRGLDRRAVVYVNTLLPFGAALFGRLTGRPVVYHLHEVSISPAPLRWFLVGVARFTAARLLYVSDFHRQRLPIGRIPSRTVHNSLDVGIRRRADGHAYRHRPGGVFRVLMLATLRDYKGVPEFLDLARRLVGHSDFHFDLVANDKPADVRRYFLRHDIPQNLTVHPRTADPSDHYVDASLVLSLSRPDLRVETFGLTLIEAMAFGIPVLVPPVGGPTELVEDGVQGYLIDSRDGDRLAQQVLALAGDEALCLRLSAACRERAGLFSPEAYGRALRAALAGLVPAEQNAGRSN